MKRCYTAILNRDASAQGLAEAVNFLQAMPEDVNDTKAAKGNKAARNNSTPVESREPDARLRAAAALCQTIFGSAEFRYLY